MGEPHASEFPADSLVEKRRRFIERQKAAHPARVDVRFAGRRPEGLGPPNRHGMPRLPVGQHGVKNWPVLDLGDLPDVRREEFRLEVGGLVEEPLLLDWSGFEALPRSEQQADFHCVTGWSRFDLSLSGVRLFDLLARVVPHAEGRFVHFTGSDRAPGTAIPYTTSLPLERALEPDVMLVDRVDGQALAREHGGPVRVITPRLYAWKGTKWLCRIELLAEDRLGFWEQRGYSNSAEPWYDDRYSS